VPYLVRPGSPIVVAAAPIRPSTPTTVALVATLALKVRYVQPEPVVRPVPAVLPFALTASVMTRQQTMQTAVLVAILAFQDWCATQVNANLLASKVAPIVQALALIRA